VATPSSTFSHSCSLVYFRFSGMLTVKVLYARE
jgi:hypothetical protein